jgi:hypothetical protein
LFPGSNSNWLLESLPERGLTLKNPRIMDGKEYSGLVYSSDDFSVLPLQGIQEERGTYACRWKNSKRQTRFKNFTVVFSTEEFQANISITIGLSATTVVMFVIAIGITLKMYLNKVSKGKFLNYDTYYD